MKLQRRLWALAGLLAVVVVVALLVAAFNYEDDTAGGGSVTEVAWDVFAYAGIVLGVVVAAAAVWTSFRRP